MKSKFFSIKFVFTFQGRRSPQNIAEFPLYRHEVAPEAGGKVPEAAHMRVELNRLDALGIDDPNSARMMEEMKDMHLSEKMVEPSGPASHTLHTGISISHWVKRLCDPYYLKMNLFL